MIGAAEEGQAIEKGRHCQAADQQRRTGTASASGSWVSRNKLIGPADEADAGGDEATQPKANEVAVKAALYYNRTASHTESEYPHKGQLQLQGAEPHRRIAAGVPLSLHMAVSECADEPSATAGLYAGVLIFQVPRPRVHRPGVRHGTANAPGLARRLLLRLL